MKVHGKKDASKHACDECDEKFYSGYLLAKHKREHADEAQENEEKKGEFEEGELRNGKEEGGLFECNFCKKLLGTPLGLRIHMRKHTGVNLARCEVGVNYEMLIMTHVSLLIIMSYVTLMRTIRLEHYCGNKNLTYIS